MVSKGVKKSSAAEVKRSKADRREKFDEKGHLILPQQKDVTKQTQEFLEKKEQLKTEKSNSKKGSNKLSTEEEKQQKKHEYWRSYYHKNKNKYREWNKKWRDKQKTKKQQVESNPITEENK